MSVPSLAPLAAFDVDHTLTRRDCVLPFMRMVAGTPKVAIVILRHLPQLIGVVVGRIDRDVAKASLVYSLFAGRTLTHVSTKGRAHADDTFAAWLRPDTLARLRWHQSEGHTTAIVSASLGPYLHPLGKLLGVDHVLCTELEHDDATGVLTGRFAGENCRGPEKVARLQAAIGTRPAEVWAYGDSAGDREMLAWADHAQLIRRRGQITSAPRSSK
jgi:phosphatidylglycerophosphatase C